MKSQIVIATHHKCGSAYLREIVELVCARRGLSMSIREGMKSERPIPGDADCVLLRNAEFEAVADTVSYMHVVRNPLDLVVSAYYSHMNTHALEGWPNLLEQRKLLRAVDERTGLIETWRFCERADINTDVAVVGPLRALREWRWDHPGETTVRMEDLVSDPWCGLATAFGEISDPPLEAAIRGQTFEVITGRKPGQVDESSHYRRGQPGGWCQDMPLDLARAIVARHRAFCACFYPELLKV